MVVNIPGVKPGELVLDGPTVAEIYMGKIAKWNDPAIKKLNPNLNLPDLAIANIHRADGSGTTFNFTYYLSQVSPEWESGIGTATTVEWPAGIGAKGNDGVANNVATTPGAIGYVEFAYAEQNKLTFTSMINKAGKTVAPTMDAFQAAAANADWSVPGFYQILANQPGDKSWPMTAATFILMYKKPVDVAASNDALKFFKWAYEKGDKMAQDLDYIPMPDKVVTLVEAMWDDGRQAEVRSTDERARRRGRVHVASGNARLKIHDDRNRAPDSQRRPQLADRSLPRARAAEVLATTASACWRLARRFSFWCSCSG